jgi:hypothetical protein
MIARTSRYDRLRHIETLDPDRDYQTIYRDMVQFEFPFETAIGFHLAFIRPFAVPNISRIVAGTGEVTTRTRKRIDDTAILMFELYEHGFDHPRGQAALRRLNNIHKYWRTSNDDYIYVLATLLIPPMRILERYGWRPVSPAERQAAYVFYRELGRRMGVRDFPGSYPALTAWFDSYEARHMRRDSANTQLMTAMHDFVGQRVPSWLRGLVNGSIDSLLEREVRAAIGVPTPPLAVRAGTRAALRLRATLTRLRRPTNEPLFKIGQPLPSYPDGYADVELVGPGDQRDVAAKLSAGRQRSQDQVTT